MVLSCFYVNRIFRFLLVMICRVTVFKYGECFHEDIQSYMYDAADWTLVGVSAIFGANAAGVSSKLMGRNQRITGKL